MRIFLKLDKLSDGLSRLALHDPQLRHKSILCPQFVRCIGRSNRPPVTCCTVQGFTIFAII